MIQYDTLRRTPSFLSIDLDYWLCTEFSIYSVSKRIAEATTFLEELARKARTDGFQVPVYRDHKKMLEVATQAHNAPPPGKLPAHILVNVDYHSDLPERHALAMEGVTTPTDGSWAAFVPWRFAGRFLWIRSCRKMTDGRCDTSWTRRFTDKKFAQHTGWKATHTTKKKITPKFLKSMNIVGAAICISPAYLISQVRSDYIGEGNTASLYLSDQGLIDAIDKCQSTPGKEDACSED